MKIEKLGERTTLRELMTHAEKCNRDLIAHFHTNIISHVGELRELSRPVRRKSHFPMLITLLNALQKFETSSEEAMIFGDYLMEQLQDIRKDAHKEQSGKVF